jgi:hypothetical protein
MKYIGAIRFGLKPSILTVAATIYTDKDNIQTVESGTD